MSRTIEHGSTNQRIRCRVLDLNGEPYEGLAYNATGIAVSFQRIGSTATSISLVLGTGLNDDHSDGKWNEIGDGWYQLDAPDGAFSGGVDSPLFYGSATGYTFIFESVMLVTSQTYPTNFASLGINASGHVSRVTLVDTTTTNTDMRGTDSAYTGTPPTAGAISTQVATDLQTAHGAGSWQTATGFGDATAANQSTIIAGLLDAAGVRTALGMASADLDTQLGAIVTDTNELQTDWADGGRLDLLLDAAAGGGGASLIVAPVTGSAPRRGTGTAIVTYAGETYTQTISGTDSNGDVIDWTALGTLVFVAEAEDGTDNFTVADGSITQTTTYCQVEIPAAANIAGRKYSWAIRLTTNDEVVLTGSMFVDYAPEVDA